MSNRLGTGYLLWLVIFVHQYAQADSTTDLYLNLVTGNKYAPFADRNLPAGGMTSEIVREAFAISGRTVNLTFLPWRRGLIGVERGLYLATFPYFYSEELAENFYYSESIYPTQQRIYISANSQIYYQNLNNLAGYRLCSPIGHAIDSNLQKLVDTAAISIISPSSTELCARMLVKNRVDFMVLDSTVYEYMFRDFNLKPVGKPLSNADLFLIMPKNNPQAEFLMNEFNQGLASIKACGLFDQIVTRHLIEK